MSLSKIALKSSDDVWFEVDEAVASESQTIKHVIEDCPDKKIPLPNVTSKILPKVIEYCKKHVEAPKTDDRAAADELKSWDADFINVDQPTLFDLVRAADYLSIRGLLDLTCQTVADMIKGKTLEEIGQTFSKSLEELIVKMLGRKITLKSSDGESFEVDEVVASESQTIKYMIADDCADNEIPLPNVTSKILVKVIEYCKKHVEAPKTDDRAAADELKSWDADFINVDQPTLFDLVRAAKYLNIRGLRDLTCQTVADMIRGKTPEEIRQTFNINNDFTPEEEAAVRRENQWAYE